MKSLRKHILICVLSTTLGLLGNSAPANASVSSSPTFELDASNASSLARSGAIAWRDLVSGGTITGNLAGDAAYNAASGGTLSISASGHGGAAFPATAAGTPTNPSGDMSLMMWVKFTSWSAGWNIMASRWFSDSTGAGNPDWHFGLYSPSTSHVLNLYTSGLANKEGTTQLALNTWYLVGFTLSWTGNLQFYVNGVADGPVITGATRSASTGSQLWVGDVRPSAYCSLCAMNGNIARFRMWNSKLDSATVLNDFNVERETFGYAPFVSSASFTLASNTPTYRTLNTITATVPINSKVTFYENTKLIPGCKKVASVSTTAICRWKPSTHGQINVRVSYTTSGSATVNWAPITTLLGSSRTGRR